MRWLGGECGGFLQEWSVSCGVAARRALLYEGVCTFKLGDVHAKGVALLEHALAAALDEVVEALGELGHAFAQVVEAEIDGGQAVGHGGRVGVVLRL